MMLRGRVYPREGSNIMKLLFIFLLILNTNVSILNAQGGLGRFKLNGKSVITGGGIASGNVPSPGATNTQYLSSYTAPSTNPCTWKISESATLTPLVHDVDPSLFSGSNSDARAEGYSSGTSRVFVAGKRRAERGSDGFWYSRALQAYTLHYYEKTCDATVTTGTFRTDNMLLGNTYSDVFPGDIADKGFYSTSGFYKWPQFTKWDKNTDPTAQAETLTDTQTGLISKRVRMPNDVPITFPPIADTYAFNNVTGTGWTNPSFILADDTNSATFSGSGRDWIFVGDGLFNYGSETITLSIKGWCSVGACSGTDKNIQACFSINGGDTCFPNDTDAKYQNVALGTSALPGTYVTLGTAVPLLDSWTPAGFQPLGYRDLAYSLGSVNVDAGGVVSWISSPYPNQTYFSPNWHPGTKIIIGASTCTVSAYTSPISITVVPGSCVPALTVPVTGASYTGTGFGFKIRKLTTSTDQINLQYAVYSTGSSLNLEWPASGSSQLSSYYQTQNSVTGENGYHVVIPSTGVPMLYWISRDSGAVNYLGLFQIPSVGGTDGYGGACSNGGRSFIGTVPTANEKFYCFIADNSATPVTVVIECTLISTNEAASLSFSCSNLTKASTGKNFALLLADFTASDTPSYDATLFGCNLNGRQGTKLVGSCQRSSQDTLSWTFMFDPNRVSNDPGCVGGGLPGCVVAAMSTWGHQPFRWCVLHTQFVSGDTDFIWTAGKYLDGAFNALGDGPFLSNITSSLTTWNTSTGAIAPGVGLCPAGSLRCDTVTVDGEPCDETPQSGEAGIAVCAKNGAWLGLQDAAVNDIFITSVSEWVKLVNKTGNSWTFQRGYGHRGPRAGANAVLNAYCSCYDFDPSEYTNWSGTWDTVNDPHGTNTTGTTVLVAWDYSHPNPDPFVTLGGNPYWDTANCPVGACYGIRTTGAIGDPAQIRVTESPKFATAGGPSAYTERAQDHPSWLQKSASVANKLWFLDARPFAPQDDISDEFNLVTGNLYKATSTTPDGDNLTLIGGAAATLGQLNRKLVQTMGYCGTQPLVDYSSATLGNTIGGTTSDNGKYCIARIAGECRVGSAPGDVYVNCANQFHQFSAKFTCSTQDQNLFNNICFDNIDSYVTSVNQMGFTGTDPTGLLGRQLTKAFSRYKLINPTTWMAQALPDASWLLMLSGYGVTVGKLPPYPTPDSVVRTTFVPYTVTLPAVGGADNAIIEFGYAENGDPGNYYCTSRQEKCVAKDATVQAIPFQFPTDGSGGVETGITGRSCASGCTIDIPGVSQRMLYYLVKYRDSTMGNATVQTNRVQIVNVP